MNSPLAHWVLKHAKRSIDFMSSTWKTVTTDAFEHLITLKM